MAQSLSTFHAPHGGDFLGLRRNRTGGMEIVYDDGADKRVIWRVTHWSGDPGGISDALSAAMASTRVIPALYSELQKRSIPVEIMPTA